MAVVLNVCLNKNAMLLFVPEELVLPPLFFFPYADNYCEFCLPVFATVLGAEGMAKVKVTIYFPD